MLRREVANALLCCVCKHAASLVLPAPATPLPMYRRLYQICRLVQCCQKRVRWKLCMPFPSRSCRLQDSVTKSCGLRDNVTRKGSWLFA